jgi:pyruvate dehydrogenase E1 component alpha subunit
MGTAIARASAVNNLSARGSAYDMPAEQLDGQNVLTVREAMDRAVARARTDSKPTLLEIMTYRYVGHSMSDAAHGTYRTKDEVEEFRRRDPIRILSDLMSQGGYLSDAELEAITTEVVEEVEDAYRFAEESPEPEPGELWEDVYAAGRQGGTASGGNG